MKKMISAVLALSLALGLAACGSSAASSTAASTASSAASSAAASSAASSEAVVEEAPVITMRVAGLKGPTSMGLVNMIDAAAAGETHQQYQFTMYGAADEIVPLLVKGELDMAAIPANLAATLYNKMEGSLEVAAINTLGVLYVVENGETIQSVADLKGRTLYSTGKGTTPEYVLRYILSENGIDPDKDLTIEYKSEATEVSALMAEEPDAIAVLPQPYVTAAGMQNENLRVALSLTDEWKAVAGTDMVTGVLVARKDFLEENTAAFDEFLADYETSVNQANMDVEGTAALCEAQGIVAKAAIAQKALPNCNIVFLIGDELKTDLSAYLQVLYDADPASVGGTLPGDDFYYVEK